MAWLMAPPAPRAAVVLLHGVRANRSDMLTRADLLLDRGYAVVLPDLQAHGESTGDVITFGHLESRDALSAFEFTRGRFPHLRVGGLGLSLGGAALILAGPELRADAMVVEGVYSTIDAAVENRVRRFAGPFSSVLSPLLLWQLEPRTGASREELRPVDKVGEVGCPIFVIGGTRDRHTTPAETRRLFDGAKGPKQLWFVQDAGHGDFRIKDPEGYRTRVLDFLDRCLASRCNT
jgi:fermentation-respiration switch protein FrsA (DUF1100 family)